MEYKLVLGLEIHLHLKTKTKMFCGCLADIYTADPNTHTCPVCLGLPGALPVPNFEAIKKVQLLGLALGCELNKNSRFDRKHYFYPDLPKGYQLSQTAQPFCLGGKVILSSGNTAEIDHIHLEEDTAKSFHQGDKTLIDFNKSGMPLVEIVTTPTFKSIEDAVEFSKKIQEVVRTLGIGDVDMEKGQMRLEANISMRTPEMAEKNELPKYKVEIKNINSFRFMERAVRAEMDRQSEILISGGIVAQENRGFNEATGKTVSQRDKEDAHDYRYFPEPDIPPMEFTQEYIFELKHSLPELPEQRIEKYKQMGLKGYDAEFFASTVNIELSEKLDRLVKFGADIKQLAPLLINKIEYRDMPDLDILMRLKEKDTRVTDTTQLEEIVVKAIENNPVAVTDYKNGKLASVEFILGQVMRETKGKADPQISREIIIKHLSN